MYSDMDTPRLLAAFKRSFFRYSGNTICSLTVFMFEFMCNLSYMCIILCYIVHMKIMKAYKFKFEPTKAQAAQLAIEFGCARFVWNRGLIERDYAYSGNQSAVRTSSIVHGQDSGKSSIPVSLITSVMVSAQTPSSHSRS